MTFGVLKEKVHQLEYFIATLLKSDQEILTKINSGNYKSSDIFDYECLSYNIAGIFLMLNLLRFDYKIETVSNTPTITLKARDKELQFNDIEKITEQAFSILKEIQLKNVTKQTQNVFDNPYLNDTVEFMYIYYYYGMKIVASFFDINLDGRANFTKRLSLGNTSKIQKDITAFRRIIAKISLLAKNKIEIYEKIKITNLRILVLEIRKNRFNVENIVTEAKTTKTNTTDEYNYVNSRINFHNTELIKFRSDLSSNELELNEELKILYNDYFNIE